MRVIRAALVLSAIGLLSGADGPKDKEEEGSLKGQWAIIAMKVMGRSAPDDLLKGLTVTFDDAKYINKNAKGEIVEEGTYKLDTGKTPWAIDFDIKKGADSGKHQLGLALIDAGTLTLAVAEPGSEDRPTILESKAGTPTMVYVLKRADK